MDYNKLRSDATFFLICGPCVIESEEHCLYMAKEIKTICEELSIPLFFKCSFDKANRTSIDSYRGPGMTQGLKILKRVKDELGLPILTDVHETIQCQEVAKVADILQIPAFLCRQTDLLLEAGKTGKIINIKKGQFCNHVIMKHAVNKIINETSNKQLMLCDRGTMFGYDDLIVDMRTLTLMRKDNPDILIVQDITHSLQQPNQSNITLGARELIPTIARASVATGIDGIFMETHDNPEKALSDKTTQYPLNKLKELLIELQQIHRITHGRKI